MRRRFPRFDPALFRAPGKEVYWPERQFDRRWIERTLRLWNAVGIQTVGSKTYAASVATKDILFTVSSGSNLALVLTLTFSSDVSNVTATWDQDVGSGGTNQAMSLLVDSRQGGGGNHSIIFGLRNPTVKTNGTLRTSWTTSSNDVFLCPLSLTGVDQTSNAAAFPHTATGATATVTITSATGNLVIACETSGVSQGTSTGTLIYDDHTSGSVINAMAQYDAGASPSVVIGNSGSNITIAAVDVGAAAGGGGGGVKPWWEYATQQVIGGPF